MTINPDQLNFGSPSMRPVRL